jgi:hypothetical protein
VALGATPTSATISSLTNGTTYDGTLAAVNALGTGPIAAFSATPSSGTATVPGPPTSVSGTAGDQQATIRWAVPSDDGGSVITGYSIQRGTQTPVTVDASTYSYVFGSLTNGTAYTFHVKAINAVGSSASADVSVTPARSTVLAAGHIPGTLQVGLIVTNDGGPRPAATEQDKIVCLNQAGVRVRNFWTQRNYKPAPITLANIKALMDEGDNAPGGPQYNIISFKYVGGPNGPLWKEIWQGQYDSDLDILATYAGNRRNATGVIKEFCAGIHHEPGGNDNAQETLTDWGLMQEYCSNYFAGWRRPATTNSSAPYTYNAAHDYSDIMAWNAIANGAWWTKNNPDLTSIHAVYPDHVVATFKRNRSIIAADFYEPTVWCKDDQHYDDVGWAPARPPNGKVEDRLKTFFDDMRSRPGGCGALGIGEFNSVDCRHDVATSGFNAGFQVCLDNVDICMYVGVFASHGGPIKWEWACEPASYPQISKVALTEYPPRVEVGGTWMTEERLKAMKLWLDKTRGLDSTVSSRMTQWTGWPAP